VSFDEGFHSLNGATHSLAGAMSKTPRGPDDVVGARGFFGRYMPACIQCRNQERNKGVVRIECGQCVCTASAS
jgi:hypothetical protein